MYHADALPPVTASKLLGTAILTIYVGQIVLAGAGMLQLAAAAIAYGAIVIGIFVYARRRGLTRRHIGLARPAGRYVLAGVLVGLSAWYLNLWIVLLLEPPGDTSHLEKVVEQTPLVTTLLGIALMPAVAEELVFRGVFVRALALRFSAGMAVLLSALAFGVYHLLPAQMISTFLLGLVLAFLTLRAHSAIPAMLAHFLNNAIAILVSRDEIDGAGDWMADNPIAMLSMCSVLLGTGLWLSGRRAAV